MYGGSLKLTVSCFYSWMSITIQWFIYMATFFNATSLLLPTLVTLPPFLSPHA
jgi:hypothetical protein